MHRSRRMLSCILVASLLGGIAPVAAHAGPNDDKTLATQKHIDSPKITWDEGRKNFHLVSEFGGKQLPIEDTANWIGRGDPSNPQYVFEVPADERMSFLGNEGDQLYWAHPFPTGDFPIWIGFGADVGIPVSEFRDESFQLDLVGFEGPGRMELFGYSDEDFPVTRMLSSHDPGFRSTWVEPGNHTHNHTTFTKPGQYLITYRASARDKSGNLIASEPQTVAWQVGGSKPSAQGLGDVQAKFDAASTMDSGPTFAVEPGDGDLTSLSLDTGNESDSGHVVFFIDGHYLAEVPVSGGVGQWNEMLGSQQSNLQAIYISDDNKAWASEPIEFTPGMEQTSTTASGSFPEPTTQDPAPAFTTDEITVTEPGISVSSQEHPVGMDMVAITTNPQDDRLSYRVIGGYYSGPDEEFPVCPIDFISAPGSRTSIQNRTDCEDMELRLRFIPDSKTNVGAVTESFPNGQGETAFTMQTGATPTTTAAPEPIEPPAEGEAVRIDRGHIDIGPRNIDGTTQLMITDDSGQHAKDSVVRKPSDVTLVVTPRSKEKVSGDVEGFDFLKGVSEAWVLGQAQQPGIVWPGFSTEHLPELGDKDRVQFTLETEEQPEGAAWFAFTQGIVGVEEMLANSKDKSTFERTGRIHLHNNWVFTKPGTYKIRVKVESDTWKTDFGTITFDVVDKAGEQPGVPVPTSTPAPKPTTPPTKGSSNWPLVAGAAGLGALVLAKKHASQGSSEAPERNVSATKNSTQNTAKGETPKAAAKQASKPKTQLAQTGANAMILVGIAMFCAGIGLALLALRRLQA